MFELKPRKTRFNPELKRRGIYLLPSLFTTAALFSGFFAIVQAIQGNFEIAASAIFIAMIMDGLDGRVARVTHTQSAFGAEYDSLSDMVCFGVAPALVIYEWALLDIGRPGWVAAFIYCASAALRLARFNTTLEVMDKRYFQGLPSPASAALVVGFVWVMINQNVPGSAGTRWLAAFITTFAGLSMVSNVRFYSFKDINLKKSVPFVAVLVMMLVFALISSPLTAEILFGMACIYGLSGYGVTLFCLLRKKNQPPAEEEHAPPV
ncbi:MAG: CDP-diacylglycerol--serine O-phosphatidyltransferase [Zoogloeaceae bacterium]|jgi:CDP-diacylglycerol--serine O-phosphatidyltransferase|nr:CDP-diacylglycerol--serine O-phosphatidyltransferase [Zoogloeaceae bacterium]